MFLDKALIKNIFHVASEKLAIGYPIRGGICPGVLNRFRDILNPNDLRGIFRDELSDCASASVKIVDNLFASKLGEFPGD